MDTTPKSKADIVAISLCEGLSIKEYPNGIREYIFTNIARSTLEIWVQTVMETTLANPDGSINYNLHDLTTANVKYLPAYVQEAAQQLATNLEARLPKSKAFIAVIVPKSPMMVVFRLFLNTLGSANRKLLTMFFDRDEAMAWLESKLAHYGLTQPLDE